MSLAFASRWGFAAQLGYLPRNYYCNKTTPFVKTHQQMRRENIYRVFLLLFLHVSGSGSRTRTAYILVHPICKSPQRVAPSSFPRPSSPASRSKSFHAFLTKLPTNVNSPEDTITQFYPFSTYLYVRSQTKFHYVICATFCSNTHPLEICNCFGKSATLRRTRARVHGSKKFLIICVI